MLSELNGDVSLHFCSMHTLYLILRFLSNFVPIKETYIGFEKIFMGSFNNYVDINLSFLTAHLPRVDKRRHCGPHFTVPIYPM